MIRTSRHEFLDVGNGWEPRLAGSSSADQYRGSSIPNSSRLGVILLVYDSMDETCIEGVPCSR